MKVLLIGAGGVGEDFAPVVEGLVGRHDDGSAVFVPAGDDLEKQVGVA